MAKVLGVGGIFFKSENPMRLKDWYAKYLGFNFQYDEGIDFKPAGMPKNGYTVWAPFKANTEYFSPSQKPYMFNLIVDDLEQALNQVKEGGADIVGEIEKLEYGDFGWFMDPDGNKVELWQPPVE